MRLLAQIASKQTAIAHFSTEISLMIRYIETSWNALLSNISKLGAGYEVILIDPPWNYCNRSEFFSMKNLVSRSFSVRFFFLVRFCFCSRV
jgi:hypothetical protein